MAANDGDAQDSITGYAISGGVDRALFAIDAGTGALTFISAPNYEDPQDAEPADSEYGGAYVVEVTATGGAGDRALTAEQTIAVTVTNVLERPSAPRDAGDFGGDAGRLHGDLDAGSEQRPGAQFL